MEETNPQYSLTVKLYFRNLFHRWYVHRIAFKGEYSPFYCINPKEVAMQGCRGGAALIVRVVQR